MFHFLPPLPPDKDSFAGYYTFYLPERCWDSRGERVLDDENWTGERFVTCVNVGSKKVTKVIDERNRKGAWSVLDVSDDIIVAAFSTPNTPPQLVSYSASCRVRHCQSGFHLSLSLSLSLTHAVHWSATGGSDHTHFLD